MKKLDNLNPTGDIGPFVGSKHLLIIGSGAVNVTKSIHKGESGSFYPMTDQAGNVVTLTGAGVIFNGKLDNDNGDARYQLELVSGTVEFGVL